MLGQQAGHHEVIDGGVVGSKSNQNEPHGLVRSGKRTTTNQYWYNSARGAKIVAGPLHIVAPLSTAPLGCGIDSLGLCNRAKNPQLTSSPGSFPAVHWAAPPTQILVNTQSVQ